MLKRMIAILLCALLLLSLVACGGGGTPSNSNSNKETQSQGGAPEETKKSSGEKAGSLSLTEYEDKELGYTMLCPDLERNRQAHTDYWVHIENDDINHPLIFFGFSEYQEANPYTTEEMLKVTDPKDLFDQFFEAVENIISSKKSIRLQNQLNDPTWKEIKVSGLPAAEFRATIETAEHGTKGITGICVIGEKRPYMFWALDLSEGQNYLDMAQEVLEACVKNFKEGS